MTDAYGDAADYRARTGPPLAGQAADVARRHGAQLARPSAAEARTRPPLGDQADEAELADRREARRRGVQTGVGIYRGPEHGAAARLRRPTRHAVAAGTTAPAG